jgi:hypothetical protein
MLSVTHDFLTSDSKKNAFQLNSTCIRNATDETWVYCCNPKTKQFLSTDTTASPCPKEVWQARSVIKNISIFFNSEGIYRHEFVPLDQMLNQPLLHIPADAVRYLHTKYDLEVVHLCSVCFVGRQPSQTFSTPLLNTENQPDA